jgi:6-pyruvoyltetrahydropterin/6-carboxytetrahydropterin synthase
VFEISVVQHFSAAHNLRNYRGKCEKLHGHNWNVEAVFQKEKLDKTQMVVDFKIGRRMLDEVLKYFDHTYINKTAYFKKVNPTSENIAKFIFQELNKKAKKLKLKVVRVNVWETPQSRATYYE